MYDAKPNEFSSSAAWSILVWSWVPSECCNGTQTSSGKFGGTSVWKWWIYRFLVVSLITYSFYFIPINIVWFIYFPAYCSLIDAAGFHKQLTNQKPSGIIHVAGAKRLASGSELPWSTLHVQTPSLWAIFSRVSVKPTILTRKSVLYPIGP